MTSDGSLQYTPNPNFHGADSFTYRASDGQAESDPATVNITVEAVNDAPVAVDDSYTVHEDEPLIIGAGGLLENDTDVDGDTLTAVLVDAPAHGTVASDERWFAPVHAESQFPRRRQLHVPGQRRPGRERSGHGEHHGRSRQRRAGSPSMTVTRPAKTSR